MKRRIAASVVAAVVCAIAAPAYAHVSVSPREAARGSSTTLTFRVPNERDDATTAKVEIELPAEQPVPVVEPRSPAGWTHEVARDGDRVARVSWTASDGIGIAGDGAQLFEVTVAPMPSSGDSVVFKVLQAYSDGEVVRWIEVPTAGAAEPDHPAPVVRLSGAPVTTTPVTATAPPTSAAVGDGRSGGGVDVPVIVALVAAAALAGAVALGKARD